MLSAPLSHVRLAHLVRSADGNFGRPLAYNFDH